MIASFTDRGFWDTNPGKRTIQPFKHAGTEQRLQPDSTRLACSCARMWARGIRRIGNPDRLFDRLEQLVGNQAFIKTTG